MNPPTFQDIFNILLVVILIFKQWEYQKVITKLQRVITKLQEDVEEIRMELEMKLNKEEEK